MKVEGATSEEFFDYLFDLGARKFLSEKGKKYVRELFEKWDPEHLEIDEDFNNGFTTLSPFNPLQPLLSK